MKLVKPSIVVETELPQGSNVLKFIEKIGRVCYKSEDKITENSNTRFIENILKQGHESIIEHFNITVRIVCDRGISHELCRHRLCSFSQESSRYVNYQKRGMEFIIPCWFKSLKEGIFEQVLNDKKTDPRELTWAATMLTCEKIYNGLIVSGWTPQEARTVLPNSLKTEVVMTTNLREWRHILKLRTSQAAHPQMKEVMFLILKEFKEKIPVLFDDIKGD